MKIELSDDLAKDLIALATGYMEQDKRYQAEPCMFTLISTIRRDCAEGCGCDYYWVNKENAEIYFYEKTDLMDYVVDCINDKANEETRGAHQIIEEDFYQREYSFEETFENRGHINPFFTAKACNEYMERDWHNLRSREIVKMRSYAFTPNKNPEMTLIAKVLEHIYNNVKDKITFKMDETDLKEI